MANRDTLTAAATASGSFRKVLENPPSEWTDLPGFAAGNVRYSPDRQSNTFYEVPGAYVVYLAQRKSDGESALDGLRQDFLAELISSDTRWVWEDSVRSDFVNNGKETTVEIMRLRIQEQLDFS